MGDRLFCYVAPGERLIEAAKCGWCVENLLPYSGSLAWAHLETKHTQKPNSLNLRDQALLTRGKIATGISSAT